jgi:serine/threonine protein kinase/tetratricopeptide (TPR) repeat protein
MAVAAGQLLGRYRLSRRVGSGGMAEVWEAVDESLHRTVALKVILEAVSREPTFAERFVREARTIAGLEHPHILPVYDFGRKEDVVYLVMPLVSGGSLKDRLGAVVPAPLAISWISGIASALDHAHARGILHRDVKPANVLLGQNDRAMLSDFGLAKSLGDSTAGLTATGAVMGTPTYMSPEQAMALTLDGRSDQYSLGIIAFQLFTGVVPFTADSPLVVLRKHLQEQPPPASRVNPRLTAAVDQALERALRKDPAERYPRCEDLARALAVASAGGPDPFAEAQRATPLPGSAKGTAVTTLWSASQEGPEKTVRAAASSEGSDVTAVEGSRWRIGPAAGAAAAIVALAVVLFVLRRPDRSPSDKTSSRLAQATAPAKPPAPVPDPVPTELSPAFAASQTLEKPPAPGKPPIPQAKRPAAAPPVARSQPPAKRRPDASGAPPAQAQDEAWSEAFEAGQKAFKTGNYRAAETSFQEALSEAERLGPNNSRLARTLRGLGAALANLARFSEAEEILRRSLKLREEGPGLGPTEITDSQLWLGFVLSRQGKARGEAETLIQQAVTARQKALGPNDPAVAFALQQLGFCYEVQGRHTESQQQLQRALSILDAAPGGNELMRAGILNDLGLTSLHEREPKEAERHLREALAIRRRLLPPSHPLLAGTQFNLAETLIELQNYSEAESLLKEALGIREKSLGPDHPMTAATLRRLAHVLRLEHRDAEADQYQAQARAIRIHRGGD